VAPAPLAFRAGSAGRSNKTRSADANPLA
jgi:hypothetical protein